MPSQIGPAFLYVLPCLGEDLLKLGFSRDPLARARALHGRYFEFFDIDEAYLIELGDAREARAMERARAQALRAHRAPMPMSINAEAGGHTEWYRGAYEYLHSYNAALEAAGHAVHRLRPWLRQRLVQQSDVLYSWAMLLSEAELAARGAEARRTPAQRHVGDLLDAYVAVGLDPGQWLPEPVMAWQRG